VTNEPRKASDILVEVESKLDKLLTLVANVDNNNKIISNKLNDLALAVGKAATAAPKYTAEAIQNLPPRSPIDSFTVTDPERQVPINADHKLPETAAPKGFRRTSRPDALEGDGAYRTQPTKEPEVKFPVQMPKGMPPPGRTAGEVVVPPPQQPVVPSAKQQVPGPKNALAQNAIPVMQRVVDKNGKSVFLADVEITDLSSAQPIFKARTNGTGKWMASLGVGAYRVTIRKGGNKVKDGMEAVQDIQVNGNESPLELQTLIIK
jgi:hypothetical protein